MHLKDLIKQLDTIGEDAQGDFNAMADAREKQKARATAVADVKKMANTPMNAIPRFGVAINPKTGQIFYGEDSAVSGQTNPRGYPFKWMQPGGPAESIKDGNRIRASGLQIVNRNGYAFVDASALATIGQASAPKKPDAVEPYDDNMKKLDALTQQLLTTIKQKSSAPATPANTAPNNSTSSDSGSEAKPDEVKADINRDSMTFGKAFADARAKGEKQFNWRGKPYAVKMAESDNLGLADALLESFGYQHLNELNGDQAWNVTKAVGAEVAPTVGAGLALTGAAKLFGKAIPGVNTAFSAKDAYERSKEGDYLGAGIAGLSGALGLTGIGIPFALGLDALNATRDYKAGKYDALLNAVSKDSSSSSAKPKMAINGDQRVYDLQQRLIAKGAKNIDGSPLVADGIMGKNTAEAMQKLAMSMPKESVAEQIGTLRDRLAVLDRVDEALGISPGTLKAATKELEAGAGAAAKDASTSNSIINKADVSNPNTIKNLQAQTNQTMGTTQPLKPMPGFDYNTLPAAKAEAEAAEKSGKLSQWIKDNQVKATALGIIAGVGAGYALTPGSDKSAELEKTTSSNNNAVPNNKNDDSAAKPQMPIGLTPEQMQIIAQMEKIISGYGDSEDPGINQHIGSARDAISQAKGLGTSPLDANSAATYQGDIANDSSAKPAGSLYSDLKVYRNRDPNGKGSFSANDYTSVPVQNEGQNTDAELARWLRIALNK